MKNILVIGAGVMGLGITQVIAQRGFNVLLKDVDVDITLAGIEKIKNQLEKLTTKGEIDKEGLNSCLSRIKSFRKKEDLENIDYVIEAVSENMEIKKKVINEIEKFCRENTIIATNTTSLSITELSNGLKNPERFIGMHFFNPVWAMKLIEIIPGLFTSSGTIEETKLLSERIDKTPVIVKESAGGIVSRILGVLINEAIFVKAEGVASAEDIDTAMKLGANLPIGPLHLADLIGLDVHLAKMESLFREFGDSKYRPHPLLRKMVRGGLLGKKTRQGFFNYSQ
ncbi:MAG: 3-hydroxyacyl-CoA dehydrogenase family protein [Candidatus Heimdallarchaeaceae archaeon]